MQKALDISYSKQFGTLNLEELNNYLSQGWCVVSTEASTGGDILVIIQEPPQQAAPQ